MSRDNVRPTLGQNILALIRKSPYKNLSQFHRAIVKLCKDNAISYSSLHNAVNDTKRPEERTLYQIAQVLKMEISELRKGTTNDAFGGGPVGDSYPYNKTSLLYILYNNLPFLPQLIKIKAKGHTSQEKEPASGKRPLKFLYICKGYVDLVLKQENGKIDRRDFRKGDVFCFDASIAHWFENRHAQPVEILVISFTAPAS